MLSRQGQWEGVKLGAGGGGQTLLVTKGGGWGMGGKGSCLELRNV